MSPDTPQPQDPRRVRPPKREPIEWFVKGAARDGGNLPCQTEQGARTLAENLTLLYPGCSCGPHYVIHVPPPNPLLAATVDDLPARPLR